MRRSIVLLTALAGCIVACKNKNTATTSVSSTAKESYEYINDKDTVKLSYTANGNAITGTLKSVLSGTHKNTGTIEGIIKGDTIIVDYTVDPGQEKTSVRQLAFLKKNGKLLEGYGPTETKNGKVVFTNTANLKFIDAVTLSSTAK